MVFLTPGFVSPATWFGRSRKELDELVVALSKSGFSRYNVLHIGPGISPDSYSPEPVELAAALESRKKPWEMTVVDYNPDVCKQVMTQEKLPINQLMTRDFPDYVARFLDIMGNTGNNVPNEVIIPRKLRERITAVQGDLTKPETFPSGSYNVLVCLNVLYHLREQQMRAIATLASKMIPGGLVLSDSDFTTSGFKVVQCIPSNERVDKRASDAYISVKA